MNTDPFAAPPTPTEPAVLGNAMLSPDSRYRYALWRTWDPSKPTIGFIGLNPSTADHTMDDPTIRRCIGFGRSLGFGGLLMLNCLAYRATDPRVVMNDRLMGVDVIGPENDAYLAMLVPTCAQVVACWGGHMATLMGREKVVSAMFPGRLYCFGKTEGGYPRHPLYLRKDAQLQPFI